MAGKAVRGGRTAVGAGGFLDGGDGCREEGGWVLKHEGLKLKLRTVHLGTGSLNKAILNMIRKKHGNKQHFYTFVQSSR